MADEKDRPLDRPQPQGPKPQPRPEPQPAAERDDRPTGKGRYRLLTQHMINDKLLPEGTEIGEGTDHPYDGTPSNQMEGLDDYSTGQVNEVHRKLYGHDAPWHNPNHPLVRARREAEEAAEQQKEELKSEPVSHQQAFERGHEEYRGERVVAPHLRPPPQPTGLSGDRSMAMGPATANQDVLDPRVDPRTTQPLKDQSPHEGSPAGGGFTPKK